MKATWFFIALETVAFFTAALTHFGILVHGYQHRQAGIAESVIGAVLLTGCVSALIRPSWIARVGVTVQSFALFGTLIGIFTIVVGVGPRTIPDLVYHACIVPVLVSGLIVSMRARSKPA